MPKPKNTTIPNKVVMLAEKIWKAAHKPHKTRRQKRVVTYVCSALVMLADYEGMTINFDTCPECGKIAVVASDGKILCPYCEEKVACPICGGGGYEFPGATVGMWSGMVKFEATPQPCWLCNGSGVVEKERAQKAEKEMTEYYSE